MRVSVLGNILALLSLGCLGVIKADFFNDYFDDKVFGANPGPCPNEGDCFIILETDELPVYIRDIEFCLFKNFFISVCDELKDWVQGGRVDLWEMQCDSIGVTNLALTETSNSEATVVNRISATNVQQSCRGKAKFTDVVLQSGRLKIFLDMTTDWTTNPDASGINIAFDVALTAAGGFDNNLVDSADVNNCDFDLELGLQVQNINYQRFTVEFFISIDLSGLRDLVTNLLLRILEGLFGSALCGVIEQAGTLSNGQPGVLNSVLNDLNERYDELIEPTFIDIEGTDAQFSADPASFGADPAKVATALRLDNSNSVEFVSVTLNNFLGNPEVTPLRINQAVNLLTEPDGDMFFDVAARDLTIEFPLSFADATAKLERVTIVGLNTIDFFQFLQNDFSEGGAGLDYTLRHKFEMETFQFLFTIRLGLSRGEWVTASSCGSLSNGFTDGCTSDQEVFSFDFGLKVSDIKFEAATLTAFDIDQIGGIQIGQILDRELTDFVAAADAVLSCTAPSIFAFIFSDLQMKVGEISDPFVENFSGQGVDQLIENSVELTDVLLRNLLANDLTAMMQGPVREFVNDYLKENVADVDSLVDCPPYVQVASPDPYLVLNEAPVNAIFPIINDVLGNFDANSDVDLNDFIQNVLEYYSENAEDFPLVPTPTIGDWDTKPNLIPLATLRAFEDELAFMSVEALGITNLDTISLFNAFDRVAFPFGVTSDVQFGGPGNDQLGIKVSFDIHQTNPTSIDTFEVEVFLENFHILTLLNEILLNMDSLNRLKVEELSHLPCVLSILDGVTADAIASSLSADNFDFNIEFISGDSGSTFRDALEILKAEFDNPVNPARFTRVANYFMDIGFQTGLDSLEDLDYSGQPEGCTEVASDFSRFFDIFLGFGIPNVDIFAEECLVPITPPLPIPEYEKELLGFTNSIDEIEGDLLVLRENFFIKILEDAFDVGSDAGEDPSVLENLLFSLANTSGNAIVDLFILEADNETVTFELPLNVESSILELFGIEPLIVVDGNGFKAEAKSLRIQGINKFLEKLSFFQPLSDFLLKFDLGFTDSTPLTLEIVVGLEANATIVDQAPVGSPLVIDEIIAAVELRGVQTTLEIFSVIRSDLIKKLSVAHFIDVGESQEFSFTDFATTCVLSNIVDGGLDLRTFQIDIAEIGEPVVTSQTNAVLSPGVEGIIEEVGKLFISFFADAIPNICENCIKQFVNDNFKVQLEKAREPGACPADPNFVEISAANEIFRFSDSALIEQMQSVLVDELYADNFSLWNSFMEGFTSEPFFDREEFDSGIANLSYKNTDYGGIQLKMKNVKLSGYGTFDHVQFLEPVSRDKVDFDENVDPYTVLLSFHYDGPASHVGDFSVIGHEFFTQADVVTNDVSIDLTLTDVTFGILMVLEVNLNTLMKVQFDQVDTLDELPCLLTPIQGLDVVDFNFTNGGLSAAAECFGICDSELIAASNGQIVEDNPELNEALNTFINFAVQYIESSPAQRLINVALETSEDTCASLLSGLDDFLQSGPEDADVFSLMLYIFLGVGGIGLCALAYQYPRHKKRAALIMHRFKNEHEKEFSVDSELRILQNELRPLAGSPIIPTAVKVIVPLVCSLNIIGLCFAILKQGALTILMKLTVIGMELNTIELVPFTVISTVNDMWNGGAWPLAILIIGASCAWPVVKNVILLFLWMTPTTIVPVEKRGKYFELLDIAGKWSFLDVFVVVVTLAALFSYVELSQQEDLEFLDPQVMTLELTVRPELGIVILATVAATSLLVNHVMSYYNRKSTEHYRAEYDKIAGTKSTPKLASSKRSIRDYKFPTRAVNPQKMTVLMIVNIVSFILMLVGLFLPIVTFELRGIVGLALGELDKAATKKTYSIFSLGAIISESPSETTWENFVLVYFQFMYFLVSIIGPVAQFVAVTFLLLKKFSLGNLTVMVEATMIISFWSALDVVYVGIIATLLEVTKVTEFIVDFVTSDICTNVKGAIEVFVPDEKDDSCLSVIGYFEIGAFPLAIGLIGQLTTLLIVMVLSFRIMQDRYYYSYVRSGLRPREGKPEKLGYIRDKVIKLVTVPQKRRVARTGSKDEAEIGAVEPDEMGFASANPRFAGAPSRLGAAAGEGEFVPVEESVAGTALFELMEGPGSAGRVQSQHSPVRSPMPRASQQTPTELASHRTPTELASHRTPTELASRQKNVDEEDDFEV